MSDNTTVRYGFGSDLPPELQLDSQAAIRRRLLSQLLMKQSQEPLEYAKTGPLATKPSVFQGLAKIMAAKWGREGLEQADKDEAGLQQKYNTGLTEAMERYQRLQQGGEPVMAGEGMISKADPKAAAISLVSSGYGPLRQVGMQLLKDLGKTKNLDISSMGFKDWTALAANYEPSTVIVAMNAARSGHPSPEIFLRRKGEVHGYEGRFGTNRPGGEFNMFPVYPGEGGSPGGAAPQQTGGMMPTGAGSPQPTQQVAGALMNRLPGNSLNVNPPYVQREMTINAPGGPMTVPYSEPVDGGKPVYPPSNITQIQNMPENTAATTNAKMASEMNQKRVQDSFAKAQESANDLRLLSQAAKNFNEGMKTGSLQSARNEIEKFLETAGLKSKTAGVSNTDSFMREMAGRMLQHTKELRPMSDADSKLLRAIFSGSDLSDKALERLLDIGVERSVKTLSAHTNLMRNVSKAPGIPEGFFDTWNLPIPDDVWPISIGGPVPTKPVGELTPIPPKGR